MNFMANLTETFAIALVAAVAVALLTRYAVTVGACVALCPLVHGSPLAQGAGPNNSSKLKPARRNPGVRPTREI